MKIVREGGTKDFISIGYTGLRLAAFAALSFQFARLILIFWFRAKLMPDTGTEEILAAMARGLGYDVQAGFYVALPVTLMAFLSFFYDNKKAALKTAYVVGVINCYLTSLITVISLEYVKEFGDLFNYFLFGLVYDDREAIVKMVWSQYPVITYLLAAFCGGWLLTFAHDAHMKVRVRPLHVKAGWGAKLVLSLALVACLAIFVRGGPGKYPIQFRDRDVTRDEFLNKLVLNPWSALRYAIKHHGESATGKAFKKDPTPKDVLTSFKRIAPNADPEKGVLACLSKTVSFEGAKARHIFLIVMESYDNWPFLDKYAPLKLVEAGKQLGADGVYLRSFISSNTGTMTSLSPFISGILNPGVRPNYLPSSRNPYETAPAEIFRRQGFKTRLFTGGSLSWQRLGEYAAGQGFSERYGMESIKKAKTVNEWGVDDGSLFDLVLETVDDSTPSFNLILTTGNHPTYSHDIKSEGWTDRGVPKGLEGDIDGTLPEVILGHLWYSDLSMARFARKAAKILPNTLTAATGDHFSRKFINARPTLYERTSVPLILYGPTVLAGRSMAQNTAGNHLDILPTLYELSFPTGTGFEAVGENLFDRDRLEVGVGQTAIIGPDYIVGREEGSELEALPWATSTPAVPDLKRISLHLRDLQTVSWWRIMKGEKVTP